MEVVILAGGAGTRLWPASRGDRPKQFLRISGNRTLLEESVARAGALTSEDHIWIVTLSSQIQATREVLPNFPSHRILAEPMGRNSGPACALATYWIEARRGKPVTILMMPADHLIRSDKIFLKTMRIGLNRASEGTALITYGLKPLEPRTDFGYIEVAGAQKNGTLKANAFIEKPPLATARRFQKSKRHFWNSGIFAWRSDLFKQEFARFAKKVSQPLAALSWSPMPTEDELRRAYQSLPNISIDYALMEKSDVVETVPSKFVWSDVGTWAAVYEAAAKGSQKNVTVGSAKVLDGSGNLAYSSTRPVYLFGTKDLIVIETADAIMVVPREASRNLKLYLSRI